MSEVDYSNKKYVGFGLGIVGAFFIGLGTWAFTVEVPSGAVILGSFVPQGMAVDVKASADGSVSEVFVKDGQQILVDDVLFRLSTQEEAIRLNKTVDDLKRLYAKQMRLESVIEERYPDLMSIPNEFHDKKLVADELSFFERDKETFDSQLELLSQRKSRSQQLIQELEIRKSGMESELELVKQQREMTETLFAQSNASRSKLIEAQRVYVQTEGNLSEIRTRITEAQQIGLEAEIQSQGLRERRVSDATSEIIEVRKEMERLLAEKELLEEAIDKKEVVASVSGTVIMPNAPRIGTLFSRGEIVAKIVPSDEPLLLEGMLRPEDADDVHPGMEANIILTGIKSRASSPVTGIVKSISADSMTDSKSGLKYFIVTVDVNREDTKSHYGVEPFPGMPAQAIIQAEPRTLVQYMIEPIVASFQKSMTEK